MTRVIYIGESRKYAIFVSGAAVLILSLILGLAVGDYRLTTNLVPSNGSALLTDDIIGIGCLIALTPIAIVSFLNYKYLKLVERNIPRFLRDILQSTDSGLILPNALLEASKSDHGPISYEMGIAMTKFSLGRDFGDSVMEAAKRLRHQYAAQVALILTEAYAAGGRTHDVLGSSVSLFNGLEQYSEQKQSELRPYTQLVYISVGIYLAIAFIIITQFMSRLEQIASTSGLASTGLAAASVAARQFTLNIPPLPYFVSIFFLSAILESIFAGIVAGKIVESNALSGLRHSVVLIAVAILVFNIPI
ncbi:MAG: type II secretion system F family protein [Nitrososphaerales archaeon]